ncbi:MAG: hypothetical protein Q4D41_01805 [Prevotellaceae bacterium]|nr:hypothetical protein [Prevotellaceae bacterium]
MRKFFFTLAMLLCVVVSFAQHTLATALEIMEGQNSYSLGSDERPPVLWKYQTGDNGAILKISNYGSASISFLKPDSTSVYNYYYNYSAGEYFYLVNANSTMYVATNSYSGMTSFSFNATTDSNESLGHGYSESDAVALADGVSYMFSSPSGSGSFTAYMTYTPAEDGVLELNSTSSFSSATYTVNGSSTTFTTSYNNGSYKGMINVEKDKTYHIQVSTYSTFLISVQLTHPTIGISYDLPFTGVLGENTLPAEAGSYWFSYTCASAGYLNISSDAELTNGTVKVYSGSYSSYSSPVYTLTESLNGRWEVSYGGTAYLINIDKQTATDADETFTLSYEDYAQGEKETNPIIIETVPATITTGTNRNYYYAIDVPTSENGKFLSVSANGTITSSNTQVAIKKSGTYSSEQGNASARIAVEGGSRYIIHWTNYEDNSIEFNVNFAESSAGDTYDNPIEATVGNNAFEGVGTRYYTYTATVDGRFIVNVSSSSIYVSFPKASTGYDNWTSTQNGTQYTLPVTAGTKYVIKFTGVTAGDTFDFEEGVYQPGESMTNPLVVTGPQYDLTDNTDVWLKYVSPQDGVFEMKSDVVYNYMNTIGYMFEGDSYLTSIVNSKTENGQYISYYGKSCLISKDDVILMHIVVPTAGENTKVEFGVRDFSVGESLSNPFAPVKDETVEVPISSSSLPYWCKLDLVSGTLTLSGTSYYSGYFYKNETDALNNTNGESFYCTSDYSVNPPTFNKSFTITEAGTYYVKFTSVSSVSNIIFSGDAMQDSNPDVDPLSMKDAWTLNNGSSTYEFASYTEGETAYLFWKYTAPTDMGQLITINPVSVNRLVFLTTDSVAIGHVRTNEAYILGVNAGQTVYVAANANQRELSFTTEITENPYVGHGLSADDAVAISSETKYYFQETSDAVTAHLYYTADGDGTLNISVSSYVTGTYSESGTEEASLQFIPVSGGNYQAKVSVTEGKRYDFTIKGSSSLLISTELSQDTEGTTYSTAYTAVLGENTVPKSKGTYWFKYENTALGNLTISSADELPGGKVEIYMSEYAASQGNSYYASAISQTGSYDVTWDGRTLGTYYICIYKETDSDEDDTFLLTYNDYSAGDKEDNPYVLVSFPTDVVAKVGETFYAIDVPDDGDYVINVSTEDAIMSTYTLMRIYKQGETRYDGVSGSTELTVTGESGTRYLLLIHNEETAAITYHIEFNKAMAGDIITNPLTAEIGDNTISGSGIRYYIYSAKVTGVMTVTPDNTSTTVSFPTGTDANSGSYNTEVLNGSYSIDIVEGTDYIIRLANATDGEKFTLAEREYAAGESETKPLDVESVYTCDGENNEIWLRYTSNRDGLCTLSSDISYDGTYTFDMKKENADYVTPVRISYKSDDTYVYAYKGQMAVKEGESVIVHIKTTYPMEGNKVTFATRDVEVGETEDNPLVLTNDRMYTLPVVSASMPYWCKLDLEVGDVTLTTTGSVSGNWYTNYDNIATGDYYTFTTNSDGYNYSCDEEHVGTHYLKFVSSTERLRLTVTGMTTAVNTIDGIGEKGLEVTKNGITVSGENMSLSVYDTNGICFENSIVNGKYEIKLKKGIYIVRINGKKSKIIVR